MSAEPMQVDTEVVAAAAATAGPKQYQTLTLEALIGVMIANGANVPDLMRCDQHGTLFYVLTDAKRDAVCGQCPIGEEMFQLVAPHAPMNVKAPDFLAHLRQHWLTLHRALTPASSGADEHAATQAWWSYFAYLWAKVRVPFHAHPTAPHIDAWRTLMRTFEEQDWPLHNRNNPVTTTNTWCTVHRRLGAHMFPLHGRYDVACGVCPIAVHTNSTQGVNMRKYGNPEATRS